jgi:hypothetical protein
MTGDLPPVGERLFTRRSLVLSVGLMIVFAVLLYLSGRPAWCKYGIGFWAPIWTHCTSQHLFDLYTFSHVLHGIIFFWLLWPFAEKIALHWRMFIALALEIGWELLENSQWVIDRYRQDTVAFDYSGDSILNSLGDVAAAVIGFVIAARYSWKVSVATFVVFELWMLAVARDNLTLNVFMLLFPIESVKQWQMPG